MYLGGQEGNLACIRSSVVGRIEEGFKSHGDVALRNIVGGHSGDGLAVGLSNLSSLFQP